MSTIHRLGRVVAVCAAAALTLSACGNAAEDEAADRGPELKLVYSVDKVSMKRLSKTPPALTLSVEGTAPTAGWENVSLEPLVIENDTLTYRLMGTPPEGMAAQVLTPVKASRLVDPLPEGVTKIRVTAKQNELVEPVPPPDE